MLVASRVSLPFEEVACFAGLRVRPQRRVLAAWCSPQAALKPEPDVYRVSTAPSFTRSAPCAAQQGAAQHTVLVVSAC